MFDKIKYIIDMNVISFWYSFYTNYMKGVMKNNYFVTPSVLERPSKYLMGLDGGESDYTINDYPVWVESVGSAEFMNLGNSFPNLTRMGLISPFCTELFDTLDRTKLLGYIILIPFEYNDDQKLYELVLGHELGHISQNHLSNTNGKILNDVDKEIEADNFSLTRYQDGYLTIDDCLAGVKKIAEISITSTIKAIPYLNKKYGNRIDEIVSRFMRYNKPFKKRLDAIYKLK